MPRAVIEGQAPRKLPSAAERPNDGGCRASKQTSLSRTRAAIARPSGAWDGASESARPRSFPKMRKAGDGIRTHDNHVGNVVLYQLSYTRVHSRRMRRESTSSRFSPRAFALQLAEGQRIIKSWSTVSSAIEARRPFVPSACHSRHPRSIRHRHRPRSSSCLRAEFNRHKLFP